MLHTVANYLASCLGVATGFVFAGAGTLYRINHLVQFVEYVRELPGSTQFILAAGLVVGTAVFGSIPILGSKMPSLGNRFANLLGLNSYFFYGLMVGIVGWLVFMAFAGFDVDLGPLG